MTRRGDTHLNEDILNAVVESVRRGNYLLTAFRAAGVLPVTANLWLSQGRRDLAAGVVSMYARFADAVDRARAASEDDLVDDLKRLGGKGDSKALMFLLERRHPKRWGKPEKPKATTDLTPEQDAAIKAALSERPK